VFANVAGETCAQQLLCRGIQGIVTEHLAHRANRLDEGPAHGSEVSTLTLDRCHARHVAEEVSEESEIEVLLGEVECTLPQLLEGQILKLGFSAHAPTLPRPESSPSPSEGKRHKYSSQYAAAASATAPSAETSEIQKVRLPASVSIEGRVPKASPA